MSTKVIPFLFLVFAPSVFASPSHSSACAKQIESKRAEIQGKVEDARSDARKKTEVDRLEVSLELMESLALAEKAKRPEDLWLENLVPGPSYIAGDGNRLFNFLILSVSEPILRVLKANPGQTVAYKFLNESGKITAKYRADRNEDYDDMFRELLNYVEDNYAAVYFRMTHRFVCTSTEIPTDLRTYYDLILKAAVHLQRNP